MSVESNGIVYRLLLGLVVGASLMVGLISHAYIVSASRVLGELVEQQERTRRGVALNSVIATLPAIEAAKLFDMALQQVDPSLQPEIRRRVGGCACSACDSRRAASPRLSSDPHPRSMIRQRAAAGPPGTGGTAPRGRGTSR